MKQFVLLLALVPTSCGSNDSIANELPQAAHSLPNNVAAEIDSVENTGSNVGDDVQGSGRIYIYRTDKLQIISATKISVATKFSPSVRAALRVPNEGERTYSNRVSDACVRELRKAGKPFSIFFSPGTIDNDGVNILIKLRVDKNSHGRPYKILLTAVQGDATWAAGLERPYYRDIPGNIPISSDGTTPNGQPYWNLGRDIDALAGRFCKHLLIGG